MRTLGQILAAKGTQVWSVTPDTSVYDAIALMAEKGIGALPVLESGKLVGIVSERDYTRKVALQGRSSKTTLVREIMTPEVVCVRRDETAQEAMAVMTAKRIRHLPVLEGDEMVGIVSIGDLVKDVISEQEFLIEQLVRYIHGR